MSDWIRVKDRMPEFLNEDRWRFTSNVLVFPDSAGEVAIAVYWLDTKRNVSRWSIDGSDDNFEPTHWMPKPHPPEEDK